MLEDRQDVARVPVPMRNANLAANLADVAAAAPDHPALRLGDQTVSYAAFEDSSARVAALLREHGLRAGDRVGLMLPNRPQFAYAYYGILRAGGVVVPMNVMLRGREVSYCLSDSGARLLLAWPDVTDVAVDAAGRAGAEAVIVGPGAFEEPRDVAPAPDLTVTWQPGGATAVIIYTSGTTGTPKGVELTHDNLGSNAAATRELLRLGPGDVVFAGLPLFHSFGQTCALNAGVIAGASLALLPRFDASAALELIQRAGVTVFLGVPTMYSAMLAEPARDGFDVGALRMCVSGGAALAVETLRAFEHDFGCVVLEGYGMTESSPVACFNHLDTERIPGSIGTPIAGVEMKLLDPSGGIGEIAIRGRNVMKGYWGRPEATAEVLGADGWLATGDIGRIDAEGRFYVVDRKKDMIIRAGYNVYPREIEEVFHEHPAVQEVAVIGLPDAQLGEEVCAAVALKPDQAATAEELQAFVRERVAPYKYPRHVWLRGALPKTSTGKITKREVAFPPALLVPRGSAPPPNRRSMWASPQEAES